MTASDAVGSETVSATLTITLFGPMQVLVMGRPVPHLRSRKSLWLLALLALRGGRPVQREWLAETLWPDADPEQALAGLRTALSELRQALGDASGRLRSPSRHTLELGGTEVDALAFDAAVAAKTLPMLEQAVSLYQGSLLEGCAEEWIGQERAAREQDCLRALLTLADSALGAGAYETASGHYRRAVSLDPWRDAARRGLMEALARSGNTNAALQVYREFVTLLRDDPKAVPDEETSALYARLRSEARQRSAATGGVPREAAKEAAGPTVTGYLPSPVTELVGREEERSEVMAKLRRSRLVTLTGPGGIGKTRLAVAVAADAAEEGASFADGVWLVALEALSEEVQVERQIASVFGWKESPGQSLRESLTSHLRAKRLLLVLDNCEHLLTTSAEVAGHLLRECAGVRVLATSREALGITGETVWTVPTLAVPDTQHLPPDPAAWLRVLMSYESVQLFVERAQAVQKTFALTGGNARDVARLCARLEGIPLAIELAAARIGVLTPAQVLAQLETRLLDALASRARDVAPRHRTLRATLIWSDDLLPPAVQVFLGELGVFQGGWTLEAAQTVCPEADVIEMLTVLRDASMIIAAGDAEGRRFSMLETVRQFAAERLESSGAATRVRARHRDYFLALAEAAEPLLNGADQRRQMARLEAEQENLRAALACCGMETDGAEAGLRLTGALWQFWERRGDYSEGRAALAKALGRPGAGQRSNARATALNSAGVLAACQGDTGVLLGLHQESLSIFRELGNRQGIAWSLYDLGNVAGGQGDRSTAQAHYEESLSLFRELEYKRGIATALHQVGSLVNKQGDPAAARTLYEESLVIFRELGNQQGIAWSLNDLGSLIREQGDYAAAQTLYEESLATFREMGHKRGSGWALHQLGGLVLDQGDYEAARTLYEESLAISRDLADNMSISWLLNDLGSLVREQGDYETAWALHAESLAINRGLADTQSIAWSLHHLGNVAAARGDPAVAQALYEESLSLFRGSGNKAGIAWSHYYLGRLTFDQGQSAAAQARYVKSIRLLWEMRDKRGTATGLRGLAAALTPEAASKAVLLWGATESLRKSIGAPLPPPEQELYEQQVAKARAALNGDAFAVAWEEGHALAWEQAVAYALEEGREANMTSTANHE